MSKRDDFESRLRSYLAAGAKKSPKPDLEERIRARAFGRRFGWTTQVLAAAAILILAIGLGIVARQARLVGVTGSPSPTPLMSPSGSVTPSVKPSESPQVSGSPYPLLSPVIFQMVDAKSGWVAGEDTNRILRTTDGGVHWNDVTPRGARAGGWITAFLDANHAWIASSLQPGSGSTDFSVEIYRTSDGGRSWQRAGRVGADAGFPSALSFVDTRNGWLFMRLDMAAGSEGVAFYGTRDGGATWTKLSEADTTGLSGHLPLMCFKNLPVFLDANHGWTPAACNNGGGPYLYATRDGGYTWNRVAIQVPAGYDAGCMCSVTNLHFTDQQNGDFLLNIYQGLTPPQNYLYTSRDGGLSWQLGPQMPAYANVFWFLDPSQGWAFNGKTRELLATGDGGRHWSAVGTIPSPADPIYLQFVTPSLAWAIGAETGGMTILKTADGGRSWTTELAPSP
jgi:photosystem II stability/assembly factor-like uncharacterized protein